MEEVFIPHNVPSLKNSKIATSRGVFASKTVKKYLTLHGIQSYSSSRKEVVGYVRRPITFPVKELKELLKDAKYPIVLGFHFVRGSKHSFDYNNVNQVVMDLLTAFNIIEDDSADYVIPYYYQRNGAYYSYDKTNPGVYIKIIK